MDRTSKFTYAELHEREGKMKAAQFSRALIAKVPYSLHAVLTDNGIQATHRKTHGLDLTHMSSYVCHGHRIEQRLMQLNHPWAHDQVALMNRTLKEATLQTYHDSTPIQLKEHLDASLNAYNFMK